MDIEAHSHADIAAVALAEGFYSHAVELAALHGGEHVDLAAVLQREGLTVFDGGIVRPFEDFKDGGALHEGEHLALNLGGRAHLKVGEAETGKTAQQAQHSYHLDHAFHYLSPFFQPKGRVTTRPNMGASRLMSITAKGAPSV